MAGSAPAAPLRTSRDEALLRLAQAGRWDLAIVGGGATGAGLAFEAARRGLRTVLLEAGDFARGTSSRSTKLVHGGVRYLPQGRIGLVREALHERARFLRIAPHLAQPLSFVIPSFHCWQTPYHGLGLKIYDLLAGSAGIGGTRFLTATQTRRILPTLRTEGLTGGVRYQDGQFDDARFLLALVRTAARLGALAVNYCEVTALIRRDGKVDGLCCRDGESGREYRIHARCVVNATGVWIDRLRRPPDAAGPDPVGGERGSGKNQTGPDRPGPDVVPSQGVHIVVDRDFLPGDCALVVPHTSDGRVLFAVPWLGKLLIGTTDTPRADVPFEPDPLPQEVRFLCAESARYLARGPRATDIRSVWAGLRPLVRPPGAEAKRTSALSREHRIWVDDDGLVTVTGGKWTIWRAMAEDVLARCLRAGLLPGGGRRDACTRDLPSERLVGAPADDGPGVPLHAPPGTHLYGSEAAVLAGLPGARRDLGGHLSEAMVRFAARHEYARCVEDVLARRSRLLFTDAALASAIADGVGAILCDETGIDPQVRAFRRLADRYLPGREPAAGAA